MMKKSNKCYGDYNARLATFTSWRFGEDSNCSASKMALAGFFSVSRDSVCCYYCMKELDGWEEEDIPWEEHKKHARYCPLVIKYYSSTPPNQLTLKETLELEKERALLFVDFTFKQKMEIIEAEFTKCYQTISRRIRKKC